jgi:hypothetical protein
VWLAAFPNSGTTYTMTMVTRASDKAVATHYAAESKPLNGTALSVYPDRPDEGPFWDGPGEDADSGTDNGDTGGLAGLRLLPSGRGATDRRPHADDGSAPAASRRVRDLPERFVLTKTHCGGRCAHCPPSENLVNASDFVRQCLRTHGQNRDGELFESSIDANGVAKVVHLVRNPYHNVVARFHLDRTNVLRRRPDLAEALPNDATGFARWCRVLDRRYESRWRWDDAETQRRMDRVACRGQFYRYAMWHEHARALPSTLAARQSNCRRRRTTSTDSTATATVPALILHYEDYQDRHNETASRLLSFLELERVAPSLEPFRPLPSYDGYYLPDRSRRSGTSSATWPPTSCGKICAGTFDPKKTMPGQQPTQIDRLYFYKAGPVFPESCNVTYKYSSTQKIR